MVLTREKKGTGIGLFTVKNLTQVCQMDINIEQSSTLGGASFILKF